jgi:hypothetical protein
MLREEESRTHPVSEIAGFPTLKSRELNEAEARLIDFAKFREN